MSGPEPASVSLDLDNLWSYQKTHGDPGWEARPTYLPRFVPLALDALDRLNLRITFFIVGVDADRPENREPLGEITARGHPVGNHSYEHEPWLHLYPRPRLEAEIARAEEAIERATGARPDGFRGPGYSWSPALLDVLATRGYRYDASTLPTWIGPLARAYYFRTARLSPEARKDRALLFGRWRDGWLRLKPYRWVLPGGRTLLELPVSTMPFSRVPFHLSYLLYLARVSEAAMLGYLRLAILACRVGRTQPSFLLHPLDLLGGDEIRELAFFPGMDLPGAPKREIFHRVLAELGRHWSLGPMTRHVEAIEASGNLPEQRIGAAEPARGQGAAADDTALPLTPVP